DAALAIGTDEILGPNLAVQVEAVADPAGHFRLAGIIGRPGIHIGLDTALVAAIGHGPGPDVAAGGAGWGALSHAGGGRPPAALLLRGPFGGAEGGGSLVGMGEVNRAAMRAIHARLDLGAPAKIGPPAIAEGIFISAHHKAAAPGRGLGRRS